MNLKEIFKITIVKSLWYVLLTAFIINILQLTFGCQSIVNAMIISAIFNKLYYLIIFGLFFMFAYKSYKKSKYFSFNGFLVLGVFYVLLTYFLSELVNISFYHLHELISPASVENQEGALGFAQQITPFSIGGLNPINYFILNPIEQVSMAFSTGNFNLFLSIFNPPSFLVVSIIIYFISLFLLFEKEKENKYHAFIPVINNLTLLKMTNKPIWWILPILIPFVGFIPKYYINKTLAEKHNKPTYYALGLTFLPWYFYGKLVFK